MYDALKQIYKSQAQPDLTTGEQPAEEPDSKTKFLGIIVRQLFKRLNGIKS